MNYSDLFDIQLSSIDMMIIVYKLITIFWIITNSFYIITDIIYYNKLNLSEILHSKIYYIICKKKLHLIFRNALLRWIIFILKLNRVM